MRNVKKIAASAALGIAGIVGVVRHREAVRLYDWPHQDPNREMRHTTICEMEDGQEGCGVAWANAGSYPVFEECMPPGTIQAKTVRMGSLICINDICRDRSVFDCPDDSDIKDRGRGIVMKRSDGTLVH